MAKMRGFKPEIWTDDKFVELSPLARLLFMGMWTYACDNGHVEDKPSQLKMRILPADSADIPGLIEEMVEQGMVERSEGFLTIPNLPLHQRIDKRYFTSCEHCPPTGDSSGTPRAHGEDTMGTRRAPTLKEGSEGSEGERKGASRKRRKPERALPEGWRPNDSHQEYATTHGLDLSAEVFKFRNHAASNDRRQRDWDAAFRTWLARSLEYASPRTRQAATRGQQPEGW